MPRRVLILVVVLLLACAAAQDPTATPQITPSIETRITLLESRLARVEADINRLAGVPSQLARIDAQVTTLVDRTDGLTGSLGGLGSSALLVVFGAVVGAVINNNRPRATGK